MTSMNIVKAKSLGYFIIWECLMGKNKLKSLKKQNLSEISVLISLKWWMNHMGTNIFIHNKTRTLI